MIVTYTHPLLVSLRMHGPLLWHTLPLILYLIFNCTDHLLRKKHYHEWIDYYHNELEKALSNYGLKANFVFRKDQLDAEIKSYGKASFGLSNLVAGLMSISVEEATAIKEAAETTDAQEVMTKTSNITNPVTVAIVKEKIEGLVDSYREFGLI